MTDHQAAWDNAEVVRLVAAQAFDRASAIVEGTLAERPWFLPALIAQGRILLASGDPEAAVKWTASLLESNPRNFWVTDSHLSALVAAGRTVEANDFFVSHIVPEFADRAEFANVAGKLLAANPAIADRIQVLSRALDARPDVPFLLAKLAGQRYLTGDVTEAAALLEKAEAIGPLPSFSRQLKLRLAVATANYADAIGGLEAISARDPENSEAARLLIRAEAADGRFQAAADHLLAAARRQPDDWLVLYRYNRTFVPSAEDRQIFEILGDFSASNNVSDLWRFQFALSAIRVGQTARARDMLADLAAVGKLSHMAAPALAALDAVETRPEPAASRIGKDRSQSLEIVRHPDAEATIVVFAGLLGGVGYLPLDRIDPLLADLPAHVVYLRDPYGLAYLRGVPALGPDAPASIDALEELVMSLGPTRVVTLGGSIAGYAAARYGLAIGASQTISFAGPTTLSAEADSDPHDPTARNTSLAMQEMRAVGGGGNGDLQAEIAAAADFHLTLVVGDGYLPDLERARRLEAQANVSVIRLTGVDHHFVSMVAIAEGRFEPPLAAAVRGTARR